MARYRVRLLGPHGLSTAAAAVDFPSGKPFALLAYLVLSGRPAVRAELAALLWADRPRERGLQSVRQALWVIRRGLGEDVVVGDDPVSLNAEVVSSDVAELRAAVAAGDAERVHELWSGAPLERFLLVGAPAWERLVEETRRELQREAAAVLGRGAEQAAAAGELEGALRHLEKACEVDPYGFELQVRRVELLLRAGRRGEAEQALGVVRSRFGDAEFAPVVARLEERLQGLQQPPGDGVAALQRPELVGRAVELSALAGLWQQARLARTQRVLLTGASGVGKSRLTEELSRVARSDGGRTVVVKPAEPERTLAWGGITTLVNRLLDMPGSAGINAASDAVLRRVVPSRARGEQHAGMPEPAALADALADLIGAIAYESPLLIALEDVQWLDAQSWVLLSRLMTQIEGEAVLFVLTLRDGEMDAETRRALRRFMQASGTRSIGLENFTPAETAEFLAFNAGVAHADHAADRMHALTRGNPLFLVEVLKMLRDRGALVLREGRWQLDEARLPDRLQLPGSVQGVLANRIERLSPSGRRVADVLAGGRSIVSYDEVRRGAGLTDAATAAAIAELIERGVAVRADEGYALAHDQLGEVLRSRPRSRRRLQLLLAAFITLAIVVLALAFSRDLFAARYGGGSLYFLAGDSLLVARPPSSVASEWRIQRPTFRRPEVKVVRGPFFTADGSVKWFADIMAHYGSPYVVQVHGDSVSAPIAIGRTDHGTLDLSPDGRHLLVGRDDPATPTYDMGVVRVPVEGGEPRLLVQSGDHVAGAWWSPDGLRIAVIKVAARDTLVVVTPRGALLRALTGRTLLHASWCNDSRTLLVLAGGGTGSRVIRYDVVTGSMAPVPGEKVMGRWVFCAPDGRHALVQDAVDGELRFVVANLATGARGEVLPVRQATPLKWQAPTLPPVARELVLSPARVALRVGEFAAVEGRLRFTHGRARVVRPELRSADPEVVAVLQDGTLIANRAGTTTVHATYADWLRDSVQVSVAAEKPGTLLLDETFATLDTARWITVGYPLPAATLVDGAPALRLNGDGNMTDGVISAATYRLPKGGTLELEVKLFPDRANWQRVWLALCAREPPPDPQTLHSFMDWRATQLITLVYPANELTKIDYSELALGLGDFGLTTRVPRELPTRDWFHVALQVGPDGFPSLYLNRRKVAQSPVRDPEFTGRDWRVCLLGHSVGTQTFVRNVRLWPGVRY